MRIVCLVENHSQTELAPAYGLSLYIETAKHKILFDLGPDDTLIKNAALKGIDLSAVDIVIISHGHADHGGALPLFLEINRSAKIYIKKEAFLPYYRKYHGEKAYIGLDSSLMKHTQFILTEGDFKIDDELFLFGVEDITDCRSDANNTLFSEGGLDDFRHEQSLLIRGTENVLVMGCGHAGVTNIMAKISGFAPKLCIGGFHLYNPTTKRCVGHELLSEISSELMQYKTDFYTCHCTGDEAYKFLSAKLPHMEYFSTGMELNI